MRCSKIHTSLIKVILKKRMKFNTTILSVMLFFGLSFTSCAKKNENVKIGVIGDAHYLSEQLMDNGSAIKSIENVSGKDITAVPQVLDQVLSEYLKSDINVLLIAGDMTKDGEKQSHLDFVKKLQPLLDKGIKVFVIPGNHDINIPHPVKYEGDKTYPVENVSPSEFVDIYKECGYNAALKRDTASLSYIAQLDDNTWLLAIDDCRYKEYTTSTISSGQISPATERWIIDIMNEAKQKNIQVMGMMHHGLVEHIMMQATFFKDYIINDWQRLAPLFADGGMKAIFTGHFHANDITEFRSPAGNNIYDIETGSLCAYPFPYRFVELSEKGMKISTKNVTSTLNNPNLAIENKNVMFERGQGLAIEKIKSMGMQLPDKTLSLLSDMVGKIFVMHLAGDEVVDDELKKTIKQLATDLDPSAPVPTDRIELDFYPADNNVNITF